MSAVLNSFAKLFTLNNKKETTITTQNYMCGYTVLECNTCESMGQCT